MTCRGERRPAEHHRRTCRIVVSNPRGTGVQDPSRFVETSLRNQNLALQDLCIRPDGSGGYPIEDLVQLYERLGAPAGLREIVGPLEAQWQRLVYIRRRLERSPPRRGGRARGAACPGGPCDGRERGRDVRVGPVAALGPVPGRALGLAGVVPGPRERLVRQSPLCRVGDLECGRPREWM